MDLHKTSPDTDLERLVLKATTALYALAVGHDGCAETSLGDLSLPELRRLGELADALSSRAFGMAAPRSELLPDPLPQDVSRTPGPPVRTPAQRGELYFEVADLAEIFGEDEDDEDDETDGDEVAPWQ